MPSVGTYKAQPVTRTLAVTQGEQGAYYFTEDVLNTWYAANSDYITKVGSLYVIPGTSTGSTFLDVVLGNNGRSELGGSGPTPRFDERKSLVDLGKEVVIGNYINSRLLVLRKVQAYSDAEFSGNGIVGYIVSENNVDDLGPNIGRFTLRVARV